MYELCTTRQVITCNSTYEKLINGRRRLQWPASGCWDVWGVRCWHSLQPICFPGWPWYVRIQSSPAELLGAEIGKLLGCWWWHPWWLSLSLTNDQHRCDGAQSAACSLWNVNLRQLCAAEWWANVHTHIHSVSSYQPDTYVPLCYFYYYHLLLIFLPATLSCH